MTENKNTEERYRYEYYPEITNLKELPVDYLLPNMKALEALAKSSKGKVTMPGVEFLCRKIKI